MLLQCRREKESAYVGSAPDWRPGFDCAEWLLCSHGVFPRCGAVVTRPAVGGEGKCPGARGGSTPWGFASRRFRRAAGHYPHQLGDWRAWRRDRKSTRLNSSHSQISYAVFCLKKKKKTNTTYNE